MSVHNIMIAMPLGSLLENGGVVLTSHDPWPAGVLSENALLIQLICIISIISYVALCSSVFFAGGGDEEACVRVFYIRDYRAHYI